MIKSSKRYLLKTLIYFCLYKIFINWIVGENENSNNNEIQIELFDQAIFYVVKLLAFSSNKKSKKSKAYHSQICFFYMKKVIN